MYTSFVLVDINKTVNVEYITDLPSNVIDGGNFTIGESRNIRSIDKTLGLDLPATVASLDELVALASTNELKLIQVNDSGQRTVVDYTYGSGIGVDNI